MTLRPSTAGRPLTPKQLQIMDFVEKFIASHRFSPTLQEIADALDVSKVTALDHVRALERRGVVRRKRYVSRCIEIVSTPEGVCPTCGAPAKAVGA